MSGSPNAPTLISAVPWIVCTDLEETLSFYEERLGFVREWSWGNPPTDAGMIRDGVRLYFNHNPQLARLMQGAEISLNVDPVDALYQEHRRRGAPIEHEIRDEPWGSREYHVRDPDGYVLRFSGEPLEDREEGES
jgi:catechol 2,3-dioxygenase-like lactoylglutathione lyase family enzyme